MEEGVAEEEEDQEMEEGAAEELFVIFLKFQNSFLKLFIFSKNYCKKAIDRRRIEFC